METREDVKSPSYYNAHPSGVECIQIAKHYDFCIGNVLKYIWRAGLKSESGMSALEKQIEDLKKARVYLDFELEMLEEKLKSEK